MAPEIPKHAKFLAESETNKPPPKIAELKKQAIRVMYEEYKVIREQAIACKETDPEKGLALAQKADKMLDEIKNLHETKNPIRDDLEKILERSSETKGSITELKMTDKEGKEYKFDLNEQLKTDTKFYAENGVDWVTIPQKIELDEEQEKEARRIIQALCPEGDYDKIKIMIIPEGLADDGTKYETLHTQMTQGYEASYQSDEFEKAGGFAGIVNKENQARLLITKEVQNLKDDELLKQTIDKSIDDLEAKGGIFKATGLTGLNPAEYLILQREYYQRTNNHLDENVWTWLPETGRPVSGRVPHSYWRPDFARLHFFANASDYHYDSLGCRLAGRLSL